MGRPYDKYKKKLMETDPRCEHCGAEAEPGAHALHYHHNQHQHTGETDHSDGSLLCARCHYNLHAVERGQHKVINEDGYSTDQTSPYYYKPTKKKKARIKQTERLLKVYETKQ